MSLEPSATVAPPERSGWPRLAVLAGVLALTLIGAATGPPLAGARLATGAQPTGSSLERAYDFLDAMMDRYARGSELRLVQSFAGGPLERRHFTDSVTYDDALVIDALLARGSVEDIPRAEVLGDSLLYVQEQDPDHDGRIRAAYAPTPLASPADVQTTDATSDVGNMAWVGQALVQLYERSGHTPYLAGATAIGEWIQANAFDERGAGGYTGGEEAGGRRIMWKSTEHNIDLYAFFSLLAAATGERVWSERADWARTFVEAMWEPAAGMFWVGTGENGVSLNRKVQAEDVNSWSYLALRDPSYATSLDWVIRELAVSRGGFSGVSFCRKARTGVWFEGTAHLADALLLRDGPGDDERADGYLADIAHAQEAGPNSDGLGIVATSRRSLGTCEGERYYDSLHTGATAWYLLALQGANPFELLP